jgi:hypothetical protein
MGFGEKTDLATGRKLNLDKTYKNVIKPAIVAAGYDCIRADEVQHSGVIDVPMYRLLFDADLVVADLSTSNLNAVFELGVRHGLKPRSTIIIAESNFQSPFDVNHIVIRKYEHLGVDIGIDEGERMRKTLTDLVLALEKNLDPDSPVYSMQTDLQPPSRGADAAKPVAPTPDPQSYGALIDVALDQNDKGNFAAAKPILQRIFKDQTEQKDPDGSPTRAQPRVVQQLALATYKLGEKQADAGIRLEAYQEAIDLLKQLDPEVTTDPETLGLWSAVHKRRAEMEARSETDRRSDVDIAIVAAERGFLIRQDYYTGGNLAYLLDYRADMSQGEDRIADRVLANRVRSKIVSITERRLAALEAVNRPVEDRTIQKEIYWNTASHTEALVGLGHTTVDQAQEKLKKCAPEPWMAETAINQIGKLAKIRSIAG